MSLRKKILLVEDNPDDVELTKIALEKSQILNEITVVNDGLEALDYLWAEGKYKGRDLNNSPALILMDLNLPKMNGLQVIEKLRSREITKSLPIVILSTSKEDQDILNGYDLGANSYVVKPVEFEKFVDTIKSMGKYWLQLNESPSIDGASQ